MDGMKEKILAKISEVEETENVRVLFACESGSRAWGFASPDSDYDVRFVYVRPLEHYLRLDKTRDVIEYELNETYDINGWDLCKLLRLLASSNPTVFEWAGSPIVYRNSDEWKKIAAVSEDCFRLKKMLHHYVSMARNNIRNYFRDDEIPLKKYLYILRPVLACEWLMTRRCPPPTDFNRFRDTVLPEELKPSVDKLLAVKKNSGEKQTGPHFQDLDSYIRDEICSVESFLGNLTDEPKADWNRLNDLFNEIAFSQ